MRNQVTTTFPKALAQRRFLSWPHPNIQLNLRVQLWHVLSGRVQSLSSVEGVLAQDVRRLLLGASPHLYDDTLLLLYRTVPVTVCGGIAEQK